MSYLVLARKWRPRSFDTLVGQDHVVRALTHALETQRLHHAWLFTGTRGVGKTTLSRILAKSLNCEKGITAQPCGQCRACVEIDAGRYVDYVELDAASNRGVDEMTQLLEQAVYAPSSARFKVYMIDEVHMLTGHAFNAMLKTLEEPPAHVKFILATTDPQKIPVTVLSRCLQFNLKHMTVDAIVGHLDTVLREEQLEYEVPALRLLAQAAGGSMRDALSLTDQAIAYSAGNLTHEAVRGMLGTIDQRHLVRLLQGLAQGSAHDVLAVADELASRGLSYSGALADLAVLLSHVAIHQRVPDALPAGDPQVEDVAAMAAMLHPDLVQLYYSIAVHSRAELSLAPDEYAGFVMACLRMLALTPESKTAPPEPSPERGGSASTESKVPSAEPPAPATTALPTSTQVDEGPDIPAWESLPDASVVPEVPPVAAPSTAVGIGSSPPRSPASEATDLQVSQLQDTEGGDSVAQAVHNEAPAGDSEAQAVHNEDPAVDSEARAVHSEAQAADVAGHEMPSGEIPDYADSSGWEPVMDDGGSEPEPLEGLPDGMGDDSFEAGALAALAPVPDSRTPRAPRLARMTAQEWPALAATLPLTGLADELARQSEWVAVEGDTVVLRVAIHSLAARQGLARLRTVLTEHFGKVVQVRIQFGATGDGTARAVETKLRAERQHQAEQAVANDPFVLGLIEEFGAQVIPGSITALENERVA